MFDTVRTSAGSAHTSSEERIRKVVDFTEMGYIGFGENTVKLGNSYGDKVIIDGNGNVLVTSPAGLGYGTGAGGTVTQLTSKSTAVTLNKPSGYIMTHASTLTDGQEVTFTVYNNLIGNYDNVFISPSYYSEFYNIKVKQQLGQFSILIKNISGATKSDNIQLNFAIIKGSSI